MAQSVSMAKCIYMYITFAVNGGFKVCDGSIRTVKCDFPNFLGEIWIQLVSTFGIKQ